MAAIQFPNNPNAGDLFVASNGIRYTYDGEKWKTLGTSTVGTEGQFLETPTELTIDKVILGNTNTGAVGSLAVGAGVSLTVPASSSFRTLSGKSGTYGISKTGGTFTGPVSFDDNTIFTGSLTGTNATFTGSLTGTNATFNGNVGIGTSSPSSTLDVSGAISLGSVAIPSAGTARIFSRNTDNALYLQTSSGNRISLLDGSQNSMSSFEPTVVKFFISNTERMRIDSSGRLLVGTTTEGAANEADDVTISGTGEVGITLRSTNSGGGRIYFSDGTSGTSEYAGYQIYNHSSNAMIFGTNAIERLRIDNSGRVGIGTTAPSAQIEIEGNVSSTTQFSGFQGLRIQNANGASYGVTADINFVAGTSSNNRGAVIGAQFESATNGNALYFATNGSSVSSNDTPTERMRIDSTGKVGIGITPQRDLHIHNASSSTNTYLQLTSATTGTTSNDGFQLLAYGNSGNKNAALIQREAAALEVWTSNTERMRIDSTGNVGIGTSSLNNYTNYNTLTLNGTSGGVVDFKSNGSNIGSIYGTGTLFQVQAQGSAIPITFRTNSAERMRIDSSGNVGIGTASPITKLDVRGTAYIGTSLGIDIANPGDYHASANDLVMNGGMTLANTSQGSIFFADSATGTGEYVGQLNYYHSTDSMAFVTNNGERMRIISSGNVGIGLSSPADLLHVHKSGAGSAYFHSTNDNTGTGAGDGVVIGISGSNTTYLWNYESGPFIVGTSGSERMRVLSDGRVSIGTTAPPTGADFTVRAPNPELSLYATANYSSYLMMGDTDDYDNGYIEYDNYDPNKCMKFFTNAGERMRILSGGGLTFNGDTAQANALDDYEEGTFNPVLVMNSGSVTINPIYNTLSYTKVGRLVTISGHIRIQGTSSPSGTLRITNIPYTAAATIELGRAGGSIMYYDNSAGSGNYYKSVTYSVVESSTTIYFYLNNTDGGITPGGGDELGMSITYVVA